MAENLICINWTMYLDAEKRKKNLLEQNQIADGMMFKMENDPRIGSKIDQKTGEYIPGIGNWIRKLSLDEFPQFFNVLRRYVISGDKTTYSR